MARADDSQALEAFEKWADEVDPDTIEVDHRQDLRAVAMAADAAKAADAAVVEAVQIARAQGRSWTQIGVGLGVSRQAARQRFGTLIDA